jgi:hypothetical protein
MAVPETAMHEYNFATRRKNQIGLAGKIPAMKAIPVAHAMHEAADLHFRLGALAVDLAHPLAPGGGRQCISPVRRLNEYGLIGQIIGQNTFRCSVGNSSLVSTAVVFTHPSFALPRNQSLEVIAKSHDMWCA